MIYNALVIGLGKCGVGFDLASQKDYIFTHTKAYMNDNRVNLIGGLDPVEKRREEFQNFSNTKAWPSVNELLDASPSVSIDIVSVCTPSHIRLEIIEGILSSIKPKVIILEKPIATKIDEAKKVEKLCKDNGVDLFINYFRRFQKGFQAIAENMKKGSYGKLQAVNVYYSNGLFNNASHFVNLLLFFKDEMPKVKWVGSTKRTLKTGDVDVNFLLSWENIDVFFHAANEDHYSFGEMDLVFSSKRVLLKNYCYELIESEVKDDPLFSNYKCLEEGDRNKEFTPMTYQAEVISEVCRFIKEGGRNISDGMSAINTLSICHEVKRKVA